MNLLEIQNNSEPMLLEFILVKTNTEEAHFNINGQQYVVRLEQVMSKPLTFFLQFSLLENNRGTIARQDLTGTGNSIQVFSYVTKFAIEHAQKKKARCVYFDADLKEPSRISLYDRLAKRIESKFGWDYYHINNRTSKAGDKYNRYILTQPDLSAKEQRKLLNWLTSY